MLKKARRQRPARFAAFSLRVADLVVPGESGSFTVYEIYDVHARGGEAILNFLGARVEILGVSPIPLAYERKKQDGHGNVPTIRGQSEDMWITRDHQMNPATDLPLLQQGE